MQTQSVTGTHMNTMNTIVIVPIFTQEVGSNTDPV